MLHLYITSQNHPSLILQALIGKRCNFNAAGFMKPQNVTTPMTTHSTLTM